MSDMVEKPSHYIDEETGMECIEITKMFVRNCTPEEAIVIKDIIKYLFRWKKKSDNILGQYQDLRKGFKYYKFLLAEVGSQIDEEQAKAMAEQWDDPLHDED